MVEVEPQRTEPNEVDYGVNVACYGVSTNAVESVDNVIDTIRCKTIAKSGMNTRCFCNIVIVLVGLSFSFCLLRHLIAADILSSSTFF